MAERLRRLAHALPTPPERPAAGGSPRWTTHAFARAAVRQSAPRLDHPVSVLTGGPGTGKTTAIKALIAALEAGAKRYALASPTGRAAKRLSEATGRPASTIHRLLGPSPGEGFKFNAQNPLPVDLLVVDEASMLDLLLANHLLKALRPGTHLLLVGDVDQLPSVGAGDVLRDVIASGLAPVTRLSVIFRQAAGSQIITNAHRINQGEMPLFPATEETAAWRRPAISSCFPPKRPKRPPSGCRRWSASASRANSAWTRASEMQVLAPMYRGPAGVHALNERLQAALNPPEPAEARESAVRADLPPGRQGDADPEQLR